MQHNELPFWLALWRIPGIGPLHFFKLLKIFPRLEILFQQKHADLLKLGLSDVIAKSIQNPPWSLVEKDLAWCHMQDRHVITWRDPTYPSLLKEIPTAPPLLFVHGDIHSLNTPQIAMVGSRNPTPTGIDNARKFAWRLSNSGLTITSGLALGIDAASHLGALAAKGKTIAVLGCGLDDIYPRTHKKLAEHIVASQGALISEFPIGTEPKAPHFPRRNRLVSGLSLGVVIVEASLRSGSLITARLANEQNREVFAIPSSIHNPLSRGCHALIQQGAKLVETVEDILEELGTLATTLPPIHEEFPLKNSVLRVLPLAHPVVLVPARAGGPASASPVGQRSTERELLPIPVPKVPADKKNLLDENYQQLLECLGFETTTFDELAIRTGFPPNMVASMVLILEMQGYITSVPGGYVRRIEGSYE